MTRHFFIRLVLVGCLLWCVSPGQGQPRRIISTDTATAARLYARAARQMQRAFAEGGSYQAVKSDLRLAEQLYRKNGVADARLAGVLFKAAIVYGEEADHKKAIDHYLTAFGIREKLRLAPDKDFAYTYVLVANLYNKIGKIDSADHYYRLGENYIVGFKNIDLIHLYYSYGLFYHQLGNCKSCLINLEKAMAISQSREADKRFVRLSRQFSLSFAEALMRCQQYGKAVAYYRQLLSAPHDRNTIRLKTGEAYLQLGKPDSALYFSGRSGLPPTTAAR